MFDPQVGDEVVDCRGDVHTITERDGDDVVLDDGFGCSVVHCLEPVIPTKECSTQPGGWGECMWYGVCQQTLPTCPANRS